MSFVRKKVIKGHDYYYLVKSKRVGKTVKQIHIAYLGKHPNQKGGKDSKETAALPAKVDAYPHDRSHPDSQYLYKHKAYSQREVYMTPDQFLRLTNTPVDFRESKHFVQGNYADVEEKLRAGKYIDPPYLDIRKLEKDELGYGDDDYGEGKGGYRWRVSGHEGRHRAFAAKRLGIKKIPVVVFHKDPDMAHMEAPQKVDFKRVDKQNPFSFGGV
jgi:hypothetical protein